MQPNTENDWYQRTTNELFHTFRVVPEQGLSLKDVSERQRTYGLNEFTSVPQVTLIDRIVGELRSPLTFILLCAGILTTFLKAYVDATVIFIALIINIAISLYQEGRADRAFEHLRASQERYATVLRGGAKQRIDAAELVPGDIILLETGMNVPADVRLIQVLNLEVNESALTGEWIDTEKNADTLHVALPLTERKNMAYMGTLITGGSARAIVVATGNSTELGVIAGALGDNTALKTPLQENVARVAQFLSYIILAALVGIFTLGLIRGVAFTELLLISIAIAVAAIPEGLPAAVTVVLAIGMESLLRRGGLVRNLLAAETLGSTTVIMTDKTGTLTKAQMRVSRIITLGSLLLEHVHKEDVHMEHEVHGDERDVLEFAALASDAYIERQSIPVKENERETVVRGRPVETAIVLAALDWGLNQTDLLANYPRIDYAPFASTYRAALSLHHVRGLKHNRLYVTGAPEYLLEHARGVYFEGAHQTMTDAHREQFTRVLTRFAEQGLRLIAVGYRDTTIAKFEKDSTLAREKMLEGLVFAGFIVLHDPLRPDAVESIRIAKHAGARVIMATGDNPHTARTIAAECGIWKEGDHVLTGSDVDKHDDHALAALLKHTSVFARMYPEHKMRLVRLLAGEGEVVAMTGDGVNDAPALRAANIGVALGSGTEVAKEASDLILLNDSFSVIVAAIEEGRRVIDNLRKIIVYLLSTSFTEIVAVAGALILGLPTPLLPAQILWTNMLSEGFMNFAFAFEPKEEDVMRRDPRTSGARSMLSRSLTIFIVWIGAVSGLLLLALYWYATEVRDFSVAEARTIVFTALTLSTTLIAFSLKDLRSAIFSTQLLSNKYLLASLAFACVGLIAALTIPLLRDLLRLTSLDVGTAAPLVFVVLLGNFIAVEAGKYALFERRGLRMLR